MYRYYRLGFILFSMMALTMFAQESKTDDPLSKADEQEVVAVADNFLELLRQKKDFRAVEEKLFVKDYLPRLMLDDRNYSLGIIRREVALQVRQDDLRDIFRLFGTYEYLSNSIFASKVDMKASSKNANAKDVFPAEITKITKELEKAIATDNSLRISSKEQFDSVLRILKRGVPLMRQYSVKHRPESSRLFRQNLEYLRKSSADMSPSLEILDESTWGFPPGTRLVVIDIPFYQLHMVKEDGKFKIILVSPNPS
jgi:hypothetical protein